MVAWKIVQLLFNASAGNKFLTYYLHKFYLMFIKLQLLTGEKNVQYLTKFSLNTTLPLGKQIQIDEPELLMQASGFFTPFLRSEKQENFTFLPIWQNAGLFLLASLSPSHNIVTHKVNSKS